MQDTEIDRRILRRLQQDPGARTADLARKVGISAARLTRRLAHLEQAGIILGVGIEIDPAYLGQGVSVSLRVRLDKTSPSAYPEFIAAACAVPEIDHVQTLLGRVDLRMNVTAHDLEEYHRIYRDKILALPHLLDIEALMLVEEVKPERGLPL